MALNLKFDNKVVFKKLNEYFRNNIKMSFKTPNKIFIITKKDIFYEIHIYDESFPKFVLCDDKSILESMIVEKLSNKNIIDLSYGICHYIAWNNKSEFFCWGCNCCGQFGNGKSDDGRIPLDCINALKSSEDLLISCRFNGRQQNEPEFNVMLKDLNIAVLKCGFRHSLALTNRGEVYAWGLNSQLTPMKMDCFGKENIVMVSCGCRHSLALTESGLVFSWGENIHGQLGGENEIYREKPELIKLENISIKKISCGQRHSLLLSNDGVVYAFGDNQFGQVGNGTIVIQKEPTRLNISNKLVDIASSSMENISVALSIDNLFFIWGKCGKEVHLTPIQINYHTFDEVFLNFTHIQYEPRGDLIKFNDWLFRYGYYESEFKEIGKEIAHGSFGRVHKVINKNGKYFAIKIVEPLDGYEKEFLREYVNQNRVNKLMGKFFVKQFDSWFENKRNEKNSGLTLYIKMELCDKTLNEVMNEIDFEFFRNDDKILSPIGYYIASDIFTEILRGVLCLHHHNIIHRDLNPSNILLKKEETGEITVKIADFGLSVLHELSDQSHTKDRGTPKYMAPEVLRNTKYDTKADIYSLGIILENLFKIETTKDYQVDSAENCKIWSKYHQASEFSSEMTNRKPSKRPKCEMILEAKHLWALNEHEFDIENELKNFFNSKCGDKNLFIYSILESKFIAIRIEMIDKSESSVIETFNLWESKPNFLQKCLVNLKDKRIINMEIRTNLIDSIVGLMRRYSDSIEIQCHAIACLYSLIENDLVERINSKQIQNAIDVTLTAMELYPNHQQLQKISLIFLYSEQILENVSSERYKCAKLVMDSLVNFKKTDINLMASVICSTLLMELSIDERSDLGSNSIYIETILNILRANDSSSHDLIQNILTTLVNLLADSSKNCLIYIKLGGLEFTYTLLKAFDGDNDIEFRVLSLLYNIAEFPYFKNDLLEPTFISILRNLLHSPKISVSFFAAGIFVQLFYVGIKSGQNELFDSEKILDELMNVILKWETLDKGSVSFVSFTSFQPLLASSASTAVQFWAIWTIHHFCSENPEKYCEILLKEIGIEYLKAFHETSKNNKCEPLISLSKKTLEIFEKVYFNIVSLSSHQIAL